MVTVIENEGGVTTCRLARYHSLIMTTPPRPLSGVVSRGFICCRHRGQSNGEPNREAAVSFGQRMQARHPVPRPTM